MTPFRLRHEPSFSDPRARLRTYAFLFAFFSSVAALQARQRRTVEAERAEVVAARAEARSGLTLAAWRTPRGVEVAVLNSLTRPVQALVAVKELAGPWSPCRRAVVIPPGGLRLRLPRAIGERVFLFDAPESAALPAHAVVDGQPHPEEGDPRILAAVGVQRGVGLETDPAGRFAWRPDGTWLIAVGGADLEGAPASPGVGDPVLDEALRAVHARPGLGWRRVGPGSPLRGRVRGPARAGVRALEVWVSVRLDGGRPRAEPLQLLVLPSIGR